LPAPPLGGAPRLRPFVRAPPLGRYSAGPRRRWFRSASRSPPRGADHLFWGFAPRRTISRVRVDGTRGLDVLRLPYERFTSGPCAPSPERPASLLAPRFTLQPGRLSPPVPSLESGSCRWPNSEPLRARPPVTLAGDGALRFFSLAPPETHGLSAVGGRSHLRPTWLSGVPVSFRGLCCRPGSAFVAPSAPPSPFETASGFSLSDLTSATKVPEDPLVEFASPSDPFRS
jgi:hypothetical protein